MGLVRNWGSHTEEIDVFFFLGDLRDKILEVFFRCHIAGANPARGERDDHAGSRSNGRCSRDDLAAFCWIVSFGCSFKSVHTASCDIDLGTCSES